MPIPSLVVDGLNVRLDDVTPRPVVVPVDTA